MWNTRTHLLLPTRDMRGGHAGSTNGPDSGVTVVPGTGDVGSWSEEVDAGSPVGVGSPSISVVGSSNGQGLSTIYNG